MMSISFTTRSTLAESVENGRTFLKSMVQIPSLPLADFTRISKTPLTFFISAFFSVSDIWKQSPTTPHQHSASIRARRGRRDGTFLKDGDAGSRESDVRRSAPWQSCRRWQSSRSQNQQETTCWLEETAAFGNRTFSLKKTLNSSPPHRAQSSTVCTRVNRTARSDSTINFLSKSCFPIFEPPRRPLIFLRRDGTIRLIAGGLEEEIYSIFPLLFFCDFVSFPPPLSRELNNSRTTSSSPFAPTQFDSGA